MAGIDTEDMPERIKKVLSRLMKVKEATVALESNLRDDLGVDSVDIWEICSKMEEEFEIEVKEQDLIGITTVQDVVNLVKAKTQTKKTD